MGEIKINLTKLESGIARLETLAKEWSSNDTTPPATVGGGKVVNELEQLAKMYKDLNDRMALLAANTATFLDSIKKSYQQSDQKAAQNINSNG